jgi:hypothetical protein
MSNKLLANNNNNNNNNNNITITKITRLAYKLASYNIGASGLRHEVVSRGKR